MVNWGQDEWERWSVLLREPDEAERELWEPLSENLERILADWNPGRPDSQDPFPCLRELAAMGVRELPLAESMGGAGSGPVLPARLLARIAAKDPALALPLADHLSTAPLLDDCLAQARRAPEESHDWMREARAKGSWFLGSSPFASALVSNLGMLPPDPGYWLDLERGDSPCPRVWLERARGDLLAKTGLLGLGLRALPFATREKPELPTSGDEGRIGFEVGERSAAAHIDHYHIYQAAILLGLSGRAAQLAERHAELRIQFKRPLARFELIRDKLVRGRQALRRLERALLVAARCASRESSESEREQGARLAAHAHALAEQTAAKICGDGMQVLGGNGFMEDSGMPKLARDAQMLAAIRPSKG